MIILFLFLLLLLVFSVKKSDENYLMDRHTTNSIKGFFIGMVFLSHIMSNMIDLGVPLNIYIDQPYFRLVCSIGQLMVVMFLFISGYGVGLSLLEKGELYLNNIPQRRILNTLVNFDMAVLIFIIVSLSIGKPLEILKTILSFAAWESVGNSNWYIFTIIISYFSTYISFKLCNSKKSAIILNFALIIIYIYVMHFFKETCWYDTALAYPFGLYIALNSNFVKSVLMQNKLYTICLGGAILLFLVIRKVEYNIYLFNILSIIFAFMFYLLNFKYTIKNYILEWLGIKLFPLYIYQRLSMIVICHLYPNFILQNHWLYVLICLIVTIIIARIYKPISFKRFKQ